MEEGTTVASRVAYALREYGVLLLVFAPLDSAFRPDEISPEKLALFLGFGFISFLAGLYFDR